jgi:hypothetical protein
MSKKVTGLAQTSLKPRCCPAGQSRPAALQILSYIYIGEISGKTQANSALLTLAINQGDKASK